MGVLTREAILATEDLKIEQISVPEWGGDVRVRTLTGTERDAFEESLFEGHGKDRKQDLRNLRARLVGLTVVDENGHPIFSAGDVDRLGEKSAAALDRIFTVAQRLSGLSARDLEVLAGNSGAGPSFSTTSRSAGDTASPGASS